MSIKKTVIMTVFISAIFVGASFMVAQAYEPLVRIPGLPTTGDINLSQYVVGLYNFLLSIVGIVAVMMLIIGGMKYITAAGNASIIADAKDTISNAIFGLLLALLSWVIVSTINPDVLYIKHPASSLTGSYTADLGNCGDYDSLAVAPAPNCTCREDVIPPVTFVGVVDQNACNIACADDCNLSDPLPCIKGGSSEKPIMDEAGNWWCYCVDGVHVVVDYGLAPQAPDDAKCNEVCSNSDWAVDNKYHGISHDVAIGSEISVNAEEISVFGGPLKSGLFEYVYFDLTEIRDCKNDIISKALDYDGGGPFLWAWTDEVCCEGRLTICPSWGVACNLFFIPPLPLPPIPIQIPLCKDDTYIDNPPGYLIYKHTYLTDGLKEVWFGITSDGPAGCQSEEFVIEIDVK